VPRRRRTRWRCLRDEVFENLAQDLCHRFQTRAPTGTVRERSFPTWSGRRWYQALAVPCLSEVEQAFRLTQDQQSSARMFQFERRLPQDEKEKARAAALWFFAALTAQHHSAASRSEDGPKPRIAGEGRRRIGIGWWPQPSWPRWLGSAERLAQPHRWRQGMDWALSGIGLAVILWWRQGRRRRY
jgi:hypothetical protein